MKTLSLGTALTLAVFSASSLRAETVKDREGALRQDKAAMEKDPRWIYNDFEQGFAEAKRTNKPLLVVLRCVPCLACAGIDAQVLEESELSPLFDQFVRVRLINANTLDLLKFQFDYDLSFSTMFFNGDGTVYGRYGSWTHQKDPKDKTTAGFKKALEGALAMHRGYPANQPLFAGKQGAPLPFRTPLEMPTITGKYFRELKWEGKVVQSCVHCHQIGDALRTYYREEKGIPEEWIYPFPMPETIGLTLETDHAARVASVAPGSIGANGGLQPGDDIVALGGQPLLSIADLSWVLHRSPHAGDLPAVLRRGGAQVNTTLVLPADWRKSSDISRRVGTWAMRAMALGGLVLEDLGDAERTRRNLPTDKLALLVKHAGQYGQHAAAKNAGFKPDDVIIDVEGFTRRVSEGELIGHLLQKYQKGEQLKVVALRADETVTLTLPMQ